MKKKQKVYQLEFRAGDNFDEDSFVLWIAADADLEVKSPSAVVFKEIEIKPKMPGIDIVVKKK